MMMLAVVGSQPCLVFVQIVSVIVWVGLPLGVVADTLAPPPVGPFNNGYGDFMVLPAEEGSTTCEYSAVYPGKDDFLDAAAKLFGGFTKSRGKVTGKPTTFSKVKDGSTVAKLTGSSVGGRYIFKFTTHEDAEKMQQVIRTFQLYMNPDFDCTTGTASMPLPVTLTVDGIAFKVAGGEETCDFSFSPVGSAETDTHKTFLKTAAAVYGAEVKSFGKVTGDPDQPARSEGPNDKGLYTAKFGGKNVGGNFVFRLSTKEEADKFRDFLQFFKRYFNPKFDCSLSETIPPPERRLEDQSIILA